MQERTNRTRWMVSVALLGAMATVLMFFSFNVPLMPSFIKMDLSELPALIASFALGPFAGACVCLIKNLVNVMFSTTGGVGELSNFILGCCFVVPAGSVYHRLNNRRGALVGAVVGALCMALISVATNYFIVYPIYMQLFMPLEVILDMYRVIDPSVNTLARALVQFNMPFTFVKGMVSTAITFLVYKRISPVLKGRKKK